MLLTGPSAVLPGGRVLAAAVACLAVALTAGAAMPRPGNVQHPSGPIGGPELAGRGVIVNYPARHAKRVPKVPASAWVIADAGTGRVLAAKDPHGLFLPASTLKVLTAITLMPVLNPDATVVTTPRAANAIPSKVGLIAGDSYKVSDLFKAMLMISANDAAMSLAQATGSIKKGVAMMNAEAHHLQAYDTVAKRPNGLNGPGQHVSAYDEALFARQALYIPQFMHDIGLKTAKFPVKPHHKPVTLWAQNTMLYTYPGDLGGKIGWTTASETTFIGWARRGGHTLIVTILHCTPLTEMTYAAKMLNWGFAMDGKVKPVGVLVKPLPVHPVTHRVVQRPVQPTHRALPPPAKLGGPGVPLLAGLGTLVLAALTGLAIVVVSRRRRVAAAPAGAAPAGGVPADGSPADGSPSGGSPPGTGPPSGGSPTDAGPPGGDSPPDASPPDASPSSASPSDASPSSASPSSASPSGASPSGASPSGASPPDTSAPGSSPATS